MFIQSKEGKEYSFSMELSSKDILEQNINETITFFDKSLHREKEILQMEEKDNIDLPIRIFREGNHGLQAIVRFLKEEKKLTFSQISKLLGRDQRTIWCTYNNIKKIKESQRKNKISLEKKNKSANNKTDEVFINSSIFRERKFSILETAAIHLLNDYSVKETASLLGRNQMTIWTVKRRAEIKKEKTTKTTTRKQTLRRNQSTSKRTNA
jgi:hypothetical protein